jgi:hypothetical protein
MGNTVVISFDDGGAKVVYASVKGGAVEVHDALVLKEGQVDAFLEKEKAKEFIVVNNFKETYHDLIWIPTTSSRYRRKIIETEIRNRCQFEDFSYIYLIAGEKTVEERKVTEVFVFAVSNHEIDGIIERFSAKGKTLDAIYPDVFLLSTMVDSVGKAVLCVTEAGSNKTLFLVKDGRIAFVRQARGSDAGIGDFDIQNINMTVNYCRQTLRINPAQIMLTGRLCDNYDTGIAPSAPLACLMPPRGVRASGAVDTAALDFIVPIAAFNAEKYMDISPADYRGLRIKKKALGYSAGAFAALSVIALIFSVSFAGEAIKARSRLKALQAGLPDLDSVISAYDAQKAALDEYAPIINSLNNAASADLAELFLAVSEIYTENVTINRISVTRAGDKFRCRVEGVIRAADYSEAQASYDRLIASVEDSQALELVDHALSLKEKGFFLEADYI